jgi:hypothetical protein
MGAGLKNLRVWSSVVLGGYAMALLLLAYFFFAYELQLISYGDSHLSEDFIIRFTAFWFISFLLTIMVYLLNLSLNYVWLPRSEKIVAVRAGKAILSLGLLAAIFIMVFISLL